MFDDAQLNDTGKIVSITAPNFIYTEKFFGSSHSTPINNSHPINEHDPAGLLPVRIF